MLLRVHCIVNCPDSSRPSLLRLFQQNLVKAVIIFGRASEIKVFEVRHIFPPRHKPLRKVNKTASRQGNRLIYFYACILGQTNRLCGDVFQLPALIQEHEKIPRVLAPGQRAQTVYPMILWMVTQRKVGYYYDCNEIIFKTVNNLPPLYVRGKMLWR